MQKSYPSATLEAAGLRPKPPPLPSNDSPDSFPAALQKECTVVSVQYA
jgi:hypothetical protein